MRERKTGLYSEDMEQINRVMRGLNQSKTFSTFIDADDLADSSNKDWLLNESSKRNDYTKFGSMRKIIF